MTEESAEFSDVLSRAMRERDLPLDRIAQRLASAGAPVSVAALSYWRSGHSIPTRAQSLQALLHLERILDVKPGHLTHALPGRGSGGPAAMDTKHIAALLRRLDLDLLPRVTHLVRHESLRVENHGGPSTRLVYQLQRCEVDGLTRLPAILCHAAAAPGSPPPVIEPSAGCRIGATATSFEHGLTVAEVFLQQPPRRGQHVAWTYWVLGESGVAEATCVVIAPIKHLVLDVTLAESPTRATYTWGGSASGAPRTVEHLSPATFMQHVTVDAGVGHHRLQWS